MYHKTVLDNGLRIITERLPHSRVTSVGIWVDAGSRDEHDLNNGSAHFVEHMLFKGTRRRTAQQIARELDVLGGTANAFTTRETTCLYATVLDTHLLKLIDLLADLFLNSLFREEEIERERHVILQEINMVEDIPDDHIHDLFASLLWGRHPLGKSVLGTREVVAAMDSKKLIDYVEHFYTPDKILISAAGNLVHDDFVMRWQEKGFGDFCRTGCQAAKRLKPAKQAPSRTIYEKPLEQVHMMLGNYGPSTIDHDRYAFIILNVLLGGNMSSRLFQEIREKRGLAYSIYSYISSYIDCGYLAVYLGIERESVNEALALIFKEIVKLRKKKVSSAELENAKEYVKGGLYLSLESMEAIMTRIARNEFCFSRNVPLEEVVEGIDRVSRKDVLQLAEKIFGSTQLIGNALGPLGANEVDWGLLQS